MVTVDVILLNWKSIVLFVVVAWLTWNWLSQRNLPPGPWGLPVVGYLPFIGDKPELTFIELGKKYGNIFSMRLGQRLMVVLNDYTSIKEAFVKNGSIFNARPPGFAFAVHDDEKGLINDKGESYMRHRRFLLNTFSNFGMGKTNLEPILDEEIKNCLDEIATAEGKPFNPHMALSLGTANVVCLILFGERFEYGNPKLEWLLKAPGPYLEISGPLERRQFFPILKYLPFGYLISRQDKLEKIKGMYDKFHLEIIKEHQDNPSDDMRDYIDAYLAHGKRMDGTNHEFDLDYLSKTLEIMFIAGAETVASALRWALLYLMAYPEVQTKVQEEIDRVIGMERLPSMNDQSQMNYTRATIMEVHRCATIVPLGVVRGNVEEVTVCGYRIPKGSYVVSNIWAVHYDEKLFEDPTAFRPERFLDENGDLKKHDYFIPFSMGKRSCVGELIAKVEVFLFLTSLLQRFTFQPEDYDPATFKHLFGDTRIPHAFTVRAVQRENFRLA